MLYPVIMAGGSGTRFWPRSRRKMPKQLIALLGQTTMAQQAVARLRGLCPDNSFRVFTNIAQADEMRRQLPMLSARQVIAEPAGRDTAACVGLAACMLAKQDPDAVMAVCSADQVIGPDAEWQRCIRRAVDIAVERHALVTFGIRPNVPAEVYGYVHRGEQLPEADGISAYCAAEFKEKPKRAQAEAWLRTGEYYWNSGNFVWTCRDILDALRRFRPDLHDGLMRIQPALGTDRQDAVLAAEYPKLPKTSIDYAVMERSDNAVVVEATFDWDDLGSWDAVARHVAADADGNVIQADHVGLNTDKCILVAEKGHLLATIGVSNLVIVQTPDATLVCDRSRQSEIKALVEEIQAKGHEAHL